MAPTNPIGERQAKENHGKSPRTKEMSGKGNKDKGKDHNADAQGDAARHIDRAVAQNPWVVALQWKDSLRQMNPIFLGWSMSAPHVTQGSHLATVRPLKKMIVDNF